MINREAWHEDIKYENAAIELLRYAEIERAAQHDIAIQKMMRLMGVPSSARVDRRDLAQ